jgi:hypothetical protein
MSGYTELCTMTDGGNWALLRQVMITNSLSPSPELATDPHLDSRETRQHLPTYTYVLYILKSTCPLRLDIPCDLCRTGFATTFHVITLLMLGKHQTLKV